MVIEEGTLKFEFKEGIQAVKFDDTEFYRKKFNLLPASKGVDILADSKEMIQFIEVKNCRGYETENMWRTSTNNSKVNSAPGELEDSERESFDIEIAKKVASTITCLVGAWTKSEQIEKADVLSAYWKWIGDAKIPRNKKKIVVILFLEGNFGEKNPKTRTKKMIMQRIQQSINSKLSWINCRVAVVDSDTYNESYFNVS